MKKPTKAQLREIETFSDSVCHRIGLLADELDPEHKKETYLVKQLDALMHLAGRVRTLASVMLDDPRDGSN